MGCAASRLEDKEAVKICRDRRDFIKQALEERSHFASSHIAYIESLKRVSMALQRFVAGDDHLELMFDPFISPVKQQKPEMVGLPYSLYEKRTIHVAKYLRSGPNPSVSVEERPRLVETVPVESHYPMDSYRGVDRLQRSSYCPSPPYNRPNYPPPPAQEPERNSYYMPYDRTSYAPPSSQEPVRTSYYAPYDRPSYPLPSPQEPARASYYAPYDRTSYPPPSPQEPTRTPYYASYDRPSYPPPSPQEQEWPQSSYGNVVTDDELARLQKVREEEGIPELEEEDDECQEHVQLHKRDENEEHDDEDDVEDEDEGEDEECEHSDDRCMASHEGVCLVNNAKQATKAFDSKGVQCTAAPEPCRTVELEIKAHKKEPMKNKVANAEETPGFTVYLNRRPASLVEAMKDIDSQFLGICDAAREVSVLLEASRAQYIATNDISAKMLNPVALLRSASSRSSSSRFLLAPSSSIEDLYDNETNSCYSEESCSSLSGSHHSTLDRLYTWEKKLYKEVKAGERLRIEYEKRLTHLRNQDVKGEEPSSVDKTRAALRSLHTRLKVSIHTVQSISRRIEVLRDEELHSQLLDLIQGLSRMWHAMAECHKAQKRTIEDAKLLFHQHHPSSATAISLAPPEATTPPPAAVTFECEIRAWRGALASWLSAQRSYARALAAWARRCLGIGAGARATVHADALPAAFVVCMEWAQAVEVASEARVMDGLDFFMAGIGSVCSGAAAGMEGMAGRVLCVGMAAVTGAMAEFAAASADGYDAAVTGVITAAKAAARVPERRKEENLVQSQR